MRSLRAEWLVGVFLAVMIYAFPVWAFDLLAHEAKRDTWQDVEKLLVIAQITPQSVVADVGAGDGYLTVRLAPRVRAVEAVEIDPRKLTALTARVSAFPNVHVRERLDDTALDVAILLNTWDVLQERSRTIREIVVRLNPGGRLVIAELDWKLVRPMLLAMLLDAGCAAVHTLDFHVAGDERVVVCEK